MIRFIDTTTPIRYQLQLDQDDEKTTFLITPLTSQELQILNDATTTTETDGKSANFRVKISLRNRIAVQLGLRGWENAPKPFETEHRSILGLPKREMIKESLLNELPIDYVNELGEKIQEISVSTGLQQKN